MSSGYPIYRISTGQFNRFQWISNLLDIHWTSIGCPVDIQFTVCYQGREQNIRTTLALNLTICFFFPVQKVVTRPPQTSLDRWIGALETPCSCFSWTTGAYYFFFLRRLYCVQPRFRKQQSYTLVDLIANVSSEEVAKFHFLLLLLLIFFIYIDPYIFLHIFCFARVGEPCLLL